MLTGQMPALAQALSGTLPPEAVQQLMQSLGNCQQALTHRGSATMAPNLKTQFNGLLAPGAWNPSLYRELIPAAGSNAFVDLPRTNSYNSVWNGGNWYGGGTFSFPINSDFTTNNYYGGDTFNVGGNSYFDDSTHLNLNATDARVTNFYATYINGQPVPPTSPAPDPGGGGEGGGGAGGGPIFGPGFPMPGPVLPGRADVKSYVTDVRAGKAIAKVTKVNTVTLPANGLATTITPKNQNFPISTSGNITVPTVKSATIDLGTASVNIPTVTSASLANLSASVNGSVNIPTSASLSGLAATCSVSASIPDTATIGGITAKSSAVAFAIPTSLTLPTYTATCSPMNIPTSASVDALGSGYVYINEVTGGYLDANCTLQLTKALKYYQVSMPEFAVYLTATPTTPTITVNTSGSASLVTTNQSVTPTITVNSTANATLSASKSTTLNGSVVFTNSGNITLSNTSTPFTGAVTVTNYGDIKLNTSNVSVSLNLSGTNANVSLTPENLSIPVSCSGELTLAQVDSVTVDADQELDVDADEVEVEVPIDPALRVKKDFLVYYRPRF
jgi:hypothetical protein